MLDILISFVLVMYIPKSVQSTTDLFVLPVGIYFKSKMARYEQPIGLPSPFALLQRDESSRCLLLQPPRHHAACPVIVHGGFIWWISRAGRSWLTLAQTLGKKGGIEALVSRRCTTFKRRSGQQSSIRLLFVSRTNTYPRLVVPFLST